MSERKRNSLSRSPGVCPTWAYCNRVRVPCFMNSNKITKLDYDNCEVVRLCGKAVYVKDMSLRTETCYKADVVSELAPHSEALSSVAEVKHEVVYRNNTFLLGEASLWSVGRFKSTDKTYAPDVAMRLVLPNEESAEGIVVVSEPVISLRLPGHGEECGKPVWSKARTKEEEATGGDL